ncbi:MAG: DoxX family protein [Gemmatimonadota bacterium]
MKLGRFEPLALNLLRIMAGFLFLQHGAAKLWGWFDGSVVEFPELRFFAGVIEFFGGIAIMVGLKTRWVAFLASGLMAFAYFLSHAPRGFWPYENGGTTAILYCFIFLYLFVRGGGGISVDGLLKGRAGRRDV